MIDRKVTLSLIALTAVAGLATPAFAQETAPSEPPPAATHRSSSGGAGRGWGVGATALIGGPAGVQGVYDLGQFHLEALVGFSRQPVGGPNSEKATTLDLGAGGWYHFATGDSSDFSLGGDIGFSHFSGGNGATAVVIAPGAMIRAFVTSNVAVHGRMALAMSFDNAGSISEGLVLDGNILAGFGATYFF